MNNNFSSSHESDYLKSPVKIHLLFENDEDILGDQLINLLKCLDIINDLGIATIDKKYEEIAIDRFFYYKSSRPIEEDRRLRITEISKKSPIELTIILGCLGGAWVLIQIIDKIANWRLNREKLKLEIDNLKSKNIQTRQRQELEENNYIEYIQEDIQIQRRIIRIKNDLTANQLKLKDFDIKS